MLKTQKIFSELQIYSKTCKKIFMDPSGQIHLTAPPPFRAFFAKIRGAVVSPLPFFPIIEKKRSFTRKKSKIFFSFGEIRGGQLGGFALILDKIPPRELEVRWDLRAIDIK